MACFTYCKSDSDRILYMVGGPSATRCHYVNCKPLHALCCCRPEVQHCGPSLDCQLEPAGRSGPVRRMNFCSSIAVNSSADEDKLSNKPTKSHLWVSVRRIYPLQHQDTHGPSSAAAWLQLLSPLAAQTFKSELKPALLTS